MHVSYRDATEDDIGDIVRLLADDYLGVDREDISLPLSQSYVAAFRAMQATPYQRLVVAVESERIIGTLQLILIPGLSMQGGWHGQIEAVRIASDLRGHGYGEAFIAWAVGECRSAGCRSVQLMSDATRVSAHRFWKKAGFVATHVGLKMVFE